MTAKPEPHEEMRAVIEDRLTPRSGGLASLTRVSRRTVLRSIGVGLTASGLYTATAAAGDNTFTEQLTTARVATRKYHDVATARDDGYEKLGVEPPVGHIYHNPTFIGNTGLTQPPSMLFYAPIVIEGDIEYTNLFLAGLEYHVEGDQTENPPNMFADENASRELKVTEAEGWHRSPIPDVLDVTGLHVWVHLPNPNGMFHPEHPIMPLLVGD